MRPRGQRETFSTVQGRANEGLGWYMQRREFQIYFLVPIGHRWTEWTWGLRDRQSKSTSKFLVAKQENPDKKQVCSRRRRSTEMPYFKFLGSI